MSDTAPGMRVVRGAPDDLELVALVAGLAATSASEPGGAPSTPTAWAADRGIRGARSFGTPDGTWRWSLRS